jgi:UDP-N-acetylglucosamine diphosphorylase / glucose-1-phosphate thymidylyltransferase / UDP-N-acetylgalactosamine diphosphorylase / glucosamine-1-phosphate N-acetyltransferase / galactosamine-1-phosphate N-acetyltransferase
MFENMKAIILAAGEGTRLRPLTLETPKAMVEIFGKPLLAHNMDKLLPYVNEFILVVKYKQEKVQKYFGESYK